MQAVRPTACGGSIVVPVRPVLPLSLLPACSRHYELTSQEIAEGTDETNDFGMHRARARYDGSRRLRGDKTPSGKGTAYVQCAHVSRSGFRGKRWRAAGRL